MINILYLLIILIRDFQIFLLIITAVNFHFVSSSDNHLPKLIIDLWGTPRVRIAINFILL